MKKIKKRRMRYRVECLLRPKKTPQTEELDSRSERTEWVQYSRAEVVEREGRKPNCMGEIRSC